MEHDEFIGQVQHRARLASRGDAERATRATLERLAERIADGAAGNLAAQLPREIGEHLRRRAPEQAGTGEQFSLDEFFARVAEREGVDLPEAAFHARVVVEVVDEATQGSVIEKVREQLPAEFDRLFTAGSTGRMAGGS
jgi:uncharacterized protein (DUF2267 family)